MNKVRNFILIVLGIIVAIIAGLAVSLLFKKPSKSIDFSATAYNGETVTLSQSYKDSGTVLIFIDPEVEGSTALLSSIITNKKSAQIIAVSVSELETDKQLELLPDDIKELKYLIFDSADVIKDYNIGNAPVTYFIDKDGLVQYVFIGNIKEKTIQSYIEKIIR